MAFSYDRNNILLYAYHPMRIVTYKITYKYIEFERYLSYPSAHSITISRWNKDQMHLPEIVIVGKGITFDTGGLNIKGRGQVVKEICVSMS